MAAGDSVVGGQRMEVNVARNTKAWVSEMLCVLEQAAQAPSAASLAGNAWSLLGRIANGVAALLDESDLHACGLSARSGVLDSLLVEGAASEHARRSALRLFVERVSVVTAKPSAAPASFAAQGPESVRMPAWVPADRTMGAFRLVRPMAEGGLGSVFLAQRLSDEGREPSARVVVKVPQDAPLRGGVVDQHETLERFRQEASALAAIPVHSNLARMLAFDVGATPKPFVVMEHVAGPTIQKLLGDWLGGVSVAFDMKRVLEILDGVLAGLDAMHASGVGHLDLKPDNVILREPTGAPTIVDFGLSGRTVRKKCGNPMYSAPEVWGDTAQPESAFSADVYSFACFAYELLTTAPLFDAEDPLVLIRLHFAHDGLPPGIVALRGRPELQKLAELLSRALRRHPSARPRIRMIRTELGRMAHQLQGLSWPLSTHGRPETFDELDATQIS